MCITFSNNFMILHVLIIEYSQKNNSAICFSFINDVNFTRDHHINQWAWFSHYGTIVSASRIWKKVINVAVNMVFFTTQYNCFSIWSMKMVTSGYLCNDICQVPHSGVTAGKETQMTLRTWPLKMVSKNLN